MNTLEYLDFCLTSLYVNVHCTAPSARVLVYCSNFQTPSIIPSDCICYSLSKIRLPDTPPALVSVATNLPPISSTVEVQ